MMRLLYITNQICGSGGLERVLSIKANFLSEYMGYEIHIITLNQKNKPIFYNFSSKIIYHDITLLEKGLNYLFRYYKRLNRLIKNVNPDIISVCDDGLKGMIIPPLINHNKPIIYERHVSKNIEIKEDSPSLVDRFKTKAIHYLMQIGAKRFDKFVVLTKGNASEWKLNNLIIIPNPLSFTNSKISTLDNKKVLVVGRHAYQKGYDRLLKVWSIVTKNFPEWELNIYGKIDRGLNYSGLAKKLNIHNSVNFYGPIKDIEKEYLQSSIYLMTSRFEGFGMVLIEAMAHGIPCISFKCPWGPEDIIIDEKNGFLVKNGDIIEFSEKLEQLMSNSNLRQKMGKQAKIKTSDYLPERIMPIWDNLFKGLINER